ncbi:MAG: D-alanyl-D-alanine carboxypeptidase [Bacteroidaceae bacterium]|nr:D-alanyl-D-alanine carboxypeptidase [Bacteroidaceae bacterium]
MANKKTNGKMASAPRRKKRKLKKGVKRGCSVAVVFLLLFAGLTYYECSRPGVKETKTLGMEWVEEQPDATDSVLSERIARLLEGPLRVDTARMGISVYDLRTRAVVYRHKHEMLLPPASCMKMLSAVASLHRLGVDHCYESRLYIRGEVEDGALQGDVILCLDDDPEIETLQPFADALVRRGINQVEGGCYVDLVRGDTLRQHPSAKPWDIPFRKLSLLLKGEKTVRDAWDRELAQRQIRVKNNPAASHPLLVASADSTLRQTVREVLSQAELIHTVQTPLLQPMTPMLTNSSNIKAESIYYHLQHRAQRWPGDDSAPYSVAQFIEEELRLQPSTYVINDGSGLSPDNRLTAEFLTRLLVYAYQERDIWKTLQGSLLATPGTSPRCGSLLDRMTGPQFRERIYCKTGTLTTCGVSSLCGYAQGSDGRWYAFSIINDNSPIYESRNFQDLVCHELVRAAMR